ncbi:transcription factor kayak: isoforms D/sro-like protein [Dinothrombium tinctorium]|uniref:Transcription factor kayak: isoforms D/sro-like protein n=1 Tax=Dinothrombium tinctorium TaxID=1965070 RepID=A0A3S3SKW8_9ACAR|nr:transcription factor kayak: isoforms D/sro-like protein [Dinothrombium tinctorium]RWS16600.1 transcription factor kayak: isoforms D/sro-like protein [Dinothrombium tinctorium]
MFSPTLESTANNVLFSLSTSEQSLFSFCVSSHTQTTSTLTPTTLKNIEESLYEYSGGIPSAPVEHQHQAGFVPPLVNISNHCTRSSFASDAITAERRPLLSGNDDSMIDTDDSISQNYWYENSAGDKNSDDHSSSHQSNASTALLNGSGNASKSRTGTSGRRPKKDEKLTPEEEERRKVRRERNKQAAARCRKRRLDHTNNLIKETQGLEEKRNALQNEYQILKNQKDELQFILDSHKSECKLLNENCKIYSNL